MQRSVPKCGKLPWFNPTVASQTFDVFITSDALDETTETINLALSNPTAASLGAQSTAQVEITDDDPTPHFDRRRDADRRQRRNDEFQLGTIDNDGAQPTISIDDAPLSEGNAGTTNFTLNVMLEQVRRRSRSSTRRTTPRPRSPTSYRFRRRLERS